MKDANGKYSGYCIDLIEELKKLMKLKTLKAAFLASFNPQKRH